MGSTGAVTDEAAVVIIGGGIIGSSAAYHLAKAGMGGVLVIERSELSGGATARAAGLLCHARSDVGTIKMVSRTRAAILELEQLLDDRLDFHQVGSIRAVLGETRESELATMEACLDAAGVAAEAIDPAAARSLCPWLELGGARRIIHLAVDGYIDGARLGTAYAAAARRLGARIRREVAATGLVTDGTRVSGVVTDQGTIRAGWIVDAAGVWGAEVASWLGWGFAAAPTRSHYWITAPEPDGATGWPNVHLPDMRTYLRSELGGVLIGMQEPQSRTYHPMQLTADMNDMPLFEEERDLELLVEQAGALRGIIPDIDRWGFAHHIAGLSNYTPDGKFVIGTVPGVDGFVLAGGCCGSGVAASGGFGQVVADLVRGVTPAIDISAYRPDRFGRVDPTSDAFRQRCAAARSGKSRGMVDSDSAS
ncbi:MAG: FAD-binding oxidoreductase [Hyphomicrobiaceae bacterium]|nr:FAD-binding oxidoreductase [Hyphomicrobiaceae bacterium]